MPETYRTIGTALGTTAGTIIYSGTSGYALVNCINVSNKDLSAGNLITLELLKGGVTAYTIIRNASIPISTAFQAVDAPLALQTNDTLRATAGYTFSMDVIVSVLEVT